MATDSRRGTALTGESMLLPGRRQVGVIILTKSGVKMATNRGRGTALTNRRYKIATRHVTSYCFDRKWSQKCLPEVGVALLWPPGGINMAARWDTADKMKGASCT